MIFERCLGGNLLRVASDRPVMGPSSGTMELAFLGKRLERLERLERLAAGNFGWRRCTGMKVYWRSDEMLRRLECFTSVRIILRRHNAPIAPPPPPRPEW